MLKYTRGESFLFLSLYLVFRSKIACYALSVCIVFF